MRASKFTPRSDDEDLRGIAICGLFVLVLAFTGFVALGIVMKMNGYPDMPPGIRWTPIAITMRQNGPWLLIVPLLWMISAIVAHRVERAILLWLVAGALTILAVSIPFLFLYATVNCYTRPLLIYVGPAAKDAQSAGEGKSRGRDGTRSGGGSVPASESSRTR